MNRSPTTRVGNTELVKCCLFWLPLSPRILSLIVCLAWNIPVEAGVFSTDFNSEKLSGAQTFGNACMEKTGGIMNSGVLKLTNPRPGGQGSLVLDELDPGKKVVSFNIKFHVAIGSADAPVMDDGVSVNFSPDLPNEIDAEGAGQGLSVSFSPYSGGKGSPIPAIRIKYKGTNVVASYFSLRTETSFADVEIQLDADGALTIIYNGAVAYDHSKLFSYEPIAGRFGIGAHTGSGADSHFIDNLWIRTETEMSARIATKPRQRSKVQLLPEYSVRAWHVEDGLPQNMIQALVQTRDGYLWAGTRKGLARFDGMKFTVFNSENTPELKNSIINTLCAGKDGSLWIGTDGGLVQLKDGQFTHYDRGMPSEPVKAVRETSDGSVWVGTVKGIVRYKDGKFEKVIASVDAAHEVVRVITEDSHGIIWVGVGAEVHQFNPIEGKTMMIYSNVNGMPINMVRAIQEDRKGTMWFGSNLGLNALKNEKWIRYTQKAGLGHSVVGSLWEDRSGSLWVGNYGGLSRMTNGKLAFELNSTSEPFDVINAICEDYEGNIWLASKDGLYQLRSRRVEVYTRQQGLSYPNVTAVLEDRSGTVWVATWGGGLNRLRDGGFTSFNTKNSMASDLLLSLCEDHDGSLWVGTDYGGGVYHFKNGFSKYHGPEKGISSAAIRVIYQDRKTNLWFGTPTSLQRYNQDKPVNFTRKEGLVDNDVRAILEDHKDNLWIGTMGGLSCLKDGKFTNLTTSQGLSDNAILSLCEDADQTLWIGTKEGGLNRLQNGKLTSYTKRTGLLTEEVFEILDDDLGNLWLASLNGIARVNKKNLEEFDRGVAKTISCTLYGKDDGMVNIQCNGISKPAGWKSKDGRLWFATTKGVAVIDPRSSLKNNDHVPPVMIEELIVDKKPFPVSGANPGALRIAPNRGELEFHYTALSLQVPEKNRFKYMLEGVDTDWVDAKTRRVAYYNNIAPGDYRFHVVACNNDGDWNETGATLGFRLTPSFYQTGWFSSGCVLVVGIGLAAIYQLNVRRLRRRESDLQALVEERTKHLKAEISERQRVQTQLIDVSRQAGMAEIASGVLHNVGNVLNSVNVSATLAMDRLRKSKHSSLEKAAVMIRENSTDLKTFFADDPKGKQLPDYLTKLSSHMSEEHSETVRELTSLCKNVDHIKEIVSMQQKYARMGGVIERVKASEMIKDALQINAVTLSRNTLQIRQDYLDDPVISIDKHKVLQILVNLIRNADEACDAGSKPEKQLTIRTSLNGSFIRIVTSDNGIGIRADVLTKIFSHGFTTRQNGHGFGLHNSALAAKELGGSLTAQSDGHNCGASFILEIPLEPPQEGNPRPDGNPP